MAEYRISGIWMDNNNVITHYAIHSLVYNLDKGKFTIGMAKKVGKDKAVEVLLKEGNSAKTLLWNYSDATWKIGEVIHVVEGKPLFLRTKADSTERDNLQHLINRGFSEFTSLI